MRLEVEDNMDEFRATDKHQQLKSVLLKVAVVLILLGFAGLLLWLFLNPRYMEDMLNWIKEQGFVGNLIIILAFIVIAFPYAFTGYTLFALGSGFLYQFIIGELTVFIGANVFGAGLSYIVCSKLAKDWVEKTVQSRRNLAIFLKTVQQHGFKIAFLFRFTPIPYGIQNGVFAISGLSFQKFMLAALGLVPEQCMWVYFGSTARKLADIVTGKVSLGGFQIAMMVVEIVVIVVLCIVFVFFARRALKKAIEEQKTEENQSLIDNAIPPDTVVQVDIK